MGNAKLLILSIVVGLFSSLFTAFFMSCLQLYIRALDPFVKEPLWASMAVFASILFSYSILYITGSRHAMGAGVENILYEYHLPFKKLPLKNLFTKFVSTITTIGGGGSGGVQGPSVYFGGYIGGWISEKMKLTYTERKALMLSGISSALSAIFRAPMGAFFYALEIPYKKDFETRYILPVVISSITGYIVSLTVVRNTITLPAVTTAVTELLNPINMFVYILFSLTLPILVTLFVFIDRTIKKIAELLGKKHIHSLVFAAILGVLVYLVPETGGIGYDKFLSIYGSKLYLNMPHYIVILIITKMIATSLTIRSGASAGYFGPSFFIGGLYGLLFYSLVAQKLSPIDPLIYVYMGISGFYGAASTAPLGISILVTEMGRNYAVLFPCILSAIITRELIDKNTLYSTQRPVRLRLVIERLIDLVQNTVRVYAGILREKIHSIPYEKPIPIHVGDPVDKVFHHYINSKANYLPVVWSDEKPLGLIDIERFARQIIGERLLRERFSMERTILTAPLIRPDNTLEKAMRLYSRRNVPVLIVVDEAGKYLGLLTTADIEKYIVSRIWRIARH